MVGSSQVRAWTNESGIGAVLRDIPGVKDVEISFCPGEGWLAARYIFNDLDDLIAFGDQPGYAKAIEVLKTAPHQDSSRGPHEFKGFFLPEA